MEFVGPGKKKVRKSVRLVLKDKHTLVSLKAVKREAKNMGLGMECNETNVMGVSSIFGAEGVVCGTIFGPDGGRTLKLEVFNGGDGKPVSSFEVPLMGKGPDPAGLRAVKRRVNPALAKTWNWETGGGKPAAPEPAAGGRLEDAIDSAGGEAPPPEPQPDDGLTAEQRRQAAMAADGDTEDPLAAALEAPAAARLKEPEPELEAEPSRAKKRVDGYHAFRIGVGLAMRFRRNVSYGNPDPSTMPPGRDAAEIQKGYTPGPGVGFTINAELFPGAWVSRGIAGNFGVAVGYTLVFGPAWRLNNPADLETHTPMQHEVTADARFRWQFWDSPYLPLGYLKFGIRYLAFNMNDGAVQAPHPDVAYLSLDAGLGFEVGIVPEWLHIFLTFDVLPVLSMGEISSPEEFGAGSGLGFAFGGGLRGKIWGPLGWRLDVEYSYYKLKFDRVAGEFQIWTDDDARDRYLSGLVYLTFLN